MGAAPRFRIRAVVLTGLMSAVSSLPLQACQFPDYGFGTGSAGGPDAGGMNNSPAGAAGDGGTSADGGEDAGSGGSTPDPPQPCDPLDCVPRAPAGWLGPIAFWDGPSGPADQLPACPTGYTDPTDLHHELNAPDGPCTCTCAAQGQVCSDNTALHIYSDLKCSSLCETVAPQACSAVSVCTGSQGSIDSNIPTPTGGSCKATPSGPADASWDNDSRLCNANPARVCDDPGQVCAPLPNSPYISQQCVMRVMAAASAVPPCPDGFPNATALYGSFADGRGCSECTCGDVSGGTCSGSITLTDSSDCSTGVDYVLGAKCLSFDLGQGNVKPTHVGGHYTVEGGICNVATEPKPTGKAAPNGRFTVVCCP